MVWLAYTGLLILLSLSLFQLLLIIGKPLGYFAWGGQHRILPKNLRIASVFSIILYIIFATFLVSKAGVAPLIANQQILDLGMWIFAGYFTLGIIMNFISRSKKERILMTPVALLLAVIFTVVAIAGDAKALNELSPNQKPLFVFDADKAPGWWSGGNNWPNAAEYPDAQQPIGDTPLATMNIHQGTQEEPGKCFIMYIYWNKSVDVTTALKDMEARSVVGEKDSSALKKIGTLTQTIQTPEGTKDYQLHQYDLQVSQERQVLKGLQFAYIPLHSGYIELRGYCYTPDQLSTTIEGISAVTLKNL